MAFTAESLDAYSDLVVKVGLNLRAGQRLLIIGPLANGGASLEAAPLIRRIAVSAYRAGAPLVEVLWGDEELLLLRFQHAPARLVRAVLGMAARARSSNTSSTTTPCSRSTRTIPIT